MKRVVSFIFSLCVFLALVPIIQAHTMDDVDETDKIITAYIDEDDFGLVTAVAIGSNGVKYYGEYCDDELEIIVSPDISVTYTVKFSKAGYNDIVFEGVWFEKESYIWANLGIVVFESEDASRIVSSGTCGDNLTWILDDYGTLTISGTGEMEYWYDERPWQSYLGDIKSLIIEDGVSCISDLAFSNCVNLTNVTLSNTIKNIWDGAFSSCYNLKKITIPDSVVEIGSGVFHDCYNLADVAIGSDVEKIGSLAFCNCKSLKSIMMQENVVYIGMEAFYGCDNLLNVTIGANVTNIGSAAFRNCSKLTHVIIPDSVKEIKKSTFSDCSSLINVLIGSGVTNIGERAFDGCSGLTSITIPSNIKNIGSYAFNDCISLTDVLIENGVTNIGERAFDGCSGLTSIMIPDSVTSIGEFIFRDCTSLTSAIIGDGISYVEHGAFYDCDSLTNIVIPDTVVNIGVSAFYDCDSLTNIVIPDTVVNIGRRAFASCDSLNEVKLSNSVIDIGAGAFEYCTNLTSIEIPPSITSIENDMFRYCTNLTSIEIPPSIASIGDHAFEDCSSLTNITIPGNLVNIGVYVFSGCSGLNSVLIENGVPYIGHRMFGNCDNLIEVIIPDSVTYIEEYAFISCSKLENIVIPNGVESIGDTVFAFCRNLASITIGKGVQTIGNNAFSYCDSLNNIYYISGEDAWHKISIGLNNIPLTNATIHYNYKDETDNENKTDNENETYPNRYEEITFYVEGYPEDEIILDGEPIENAIVTFRGASKKTDANGKVAFYVDELTEETGGPTVTANGYWDYGVEDLIWVMPYDGKVHISLWEKNPEKIYITNLSAVSESGKKYDLKTRKDFSVDKTDTDKYQFKINIDWNGHEEGKAYLQGEKSGKSFKFTDGAVTVAPGMEFEVGENVKVIAYTADRTKTAMEEDLINVIALPEEFSLVMPQIIDDTMSSAGFMVGKAFQLGLDTGLEKFAEKVEYVDGKLVIELSGSLGEGSSSNKKGRFEIFDGEYIEVDVKGKAELPISIGVNDWSGSFEVEGKADPIAKYTWNNWVLIPNVGYIPVTANVKVLGSLSGAVELAGDLEDVRFDGKITPSIEIDGFGGLGVDYDTAEMKAGVYVNAKGELGIISHILSLEPELNPTVEGEVGARAKIKVWIIDIEGQEELGKFRWDKEHGFRAAWFGDDISLFAQEDNAWILSGREYLENGGGFVGGESILLFDLEVTNKDEQIIYSNIFDNAEAILKNIDDKTVLIYTVDDVEREEQNGLKLVYSEKLSDGRWSEPIAIDDDGTLDSILSADENFVTWEDMKTEIPSTVTEMDEILSQTEISVAYLNDENWVTTQLTDNDIFDFSPIVKSNDDTAIVAWLSNDMSDLTSQSGTTNIHYAIFDGEKWSDIVTVEDVGMVTRVTAAYKGDTPYIFYKKDGVLHSLSVLDSNITMLSYGEVGQYAVDAFNDKVVLAYFDKNGDLKFVDDVINSGGALTVTTEANVNSIPVIETTDTEMYIAWIDHMSGFDTLCGARYENGIWSDKITFVGEEANVSNPSLVANDDGTFSASYFKTGKVEVSESGEYTTGEVNLFVNNIVPSYNLAINSETLSYDDVVYSRDGIAEIMFDIKNVGEKTVSGFDVEIYEYEELKEIISETTELKAGETANVNVSYAPLANGKIQELKIKVTPTDVDDFDESDNIATISLGTIDATVINAYFTEEGPKNFLNVIFKNNGSAVADKITVSIYKSSLEDEVIYQTEIEDVYPGEELLLKASFEENDLSKTSIFYVTATTQNDVNTYNDYSIVVNNSDIDIDGLDVKIEYDDNTKTVTIISDKAYSNAKIFIVGYNGEKLISLKSQFKDIVKGENTVIFNDFNSMGADKIKIIVLEKSENIKPLFSVFVTKSITELDSRVFELVG